MAAAKVMMSMRQWAHMEAERGREDERSEREREID